MVRQRFGRIVSTSSGAALGSAPGAAYGAAKFGVVGLMKCLALEDRPYGITANAIMPYASTSMNEEYGREADTLAEAGTESETLRVCSGQLGRDLAREAADSPAGRSLGRQVIAAGAGHVKRDALV